MSKKATISKGSLYSEGITDISKFTRDPQVYVGFSEDSSGSEKGKNSKSKKMSHKTETENAKENNLGKKRLRGISPGDELDNDGRQQNRRLSTVTAKNFRSPAREETKRVNNSENLTANLENNVRSSKLLSNNLSNSNLPSLNQKSSPTRNKTQPSSSTLINTTYHQLSKLPPASKNSINPIKKKIIIDKNIFNSEFDDDIVIEKKEEYKLKAKLDKFKQSYLNFLRDARFSSRTETINLNSAFIFSNIEKFFELYRFVKENGGYEEVIGRGLLRSFQKEKANYSSYEELRKDFNDYLYHFSLYSEVANPDDLTDNEVKVICQKNPNMLIDCPIICATEADSEREITQKIKEAMQYDLVILRGFLPYFGFDNSKFSIDYLESNSNLQNKIDVIEQAKDFTGFNPNKHARRQWTLGHYIKYVRDSVKETNDSAVIKGGNKSKEKKKKDHDKGHNNIIYYGVNIELTEYQALHEELEKKIHPLIVFGSSYDPLAYVRQHIKGMTIPQMYIKVPHVWTGGHEENLRMRSVNICHGPGESLWWSTPVEDSQKLVDKVKTLHGTNIYKKEGIWFPDNSFFYLNNIKMFYVIQKPGDIVLVGQGTIHWVKAKSHSVNTSWNFGSKDSRSLKLSMDRYEINKQIKMRSLVPMLTLILDMLNHEMDKLDLPFVETCSSYLTPAIQTSFKQIHVTVDEIRKKYNTTFMKERDNYNVENCEECLSEVFNCWAFCQICSDKYKDRQVILCLDCFKEHLKLCNKAGVQYIFYKYDEAELKKFMERLEIRLKYNNELTTFEKELKEVQPGLTKKTKDSKCIYEKKLIKIIPNVSEEEMRAYQDYPSIFREANFREISECLVPLMDIDKLRSEDFLYPLQRKALFGPLEVEDAEGKMIPNPEIDVYMDFEDLIEDFNFKRFSPIREATVKDNENEVEMDIGDNFNPMQEDNSMTGLFPQNNNIESATFRNFSSLVNPSQTMNVNLKPTIYNFQSNLPGKSLISSLIATEGINIRNSNISVHSSSEKSGSRISRNSLMKPLNASSSIQALLKDVQSINELKNNLNSNNPVNNIDTDNQSKVCEIEGLPVQQNVINIYNQKFDGADQPENNEKNMTYNPFIYNIERSNNEKASIIQQIKKAKSFLNPLADQTCIQFKMVSPELHKSIFVGINILLKYLHNKEAIEETKLKNFIQKIINNEKLIPDYRTMIREQIYDKL